MDDGIPNEVKPERAERIERPPIGIAEHLVPAVRIEQHLAGADGLTVCGVPGAHITADLSQSTCDECVIGRAEQLGASFHADDFGSGDYYWMRSGVGTGESTTVFVTRAAAARDFMWEHAALLLEMRERKLRDLVRRLGGAEYRMVRNRGGERVTVSVELPELEALGFGFEAQASRETTIEAACDFLEALAGQLTELVKAVRS